MFTVFELDVLRNAGVDVAALTQGQDENLPEGFSERFIDQKNPFSKENIQSQSQWVEASEIKGSTPVHYLSRVRAMAAAYRILVEGNIQNFQILESPFDPLFQTALSNLQEKDSPYLVREQAKTTLLKALSNYMGIVPEVTENFSNWIKRGLCICVFGGITWAGCEGANGIISLLGLIPGAAATYWFWLSVIIFALLKIIVYIGFDYARLNQFFNMSEVRVKAFMDNCNHQRKLLEGIYAQIDKDVLIANDQQNFTEKRAAIDEILELSLLAEVVYTDLTNKAWALHAVKEGSPLVKAIKAVVRYIGLILGAILFGSTGFFAAQSTLQSIALLSFATVVASNPITLVILATICTIGALASFAILESWGIIDLVGEWSKMPDGVCIEFKESLRNITPRVSRIQRDLDRLDIETQKIQIQISYIEQLHDSIVNKMLILTRFYDDLTGGEVCEEIGEKKQSETMPQKITSTWIFKNGGFLHLKQEWEALQDLAMTEILYPKDEQALIKVMEKLVQFEAILTEQIKTLSQWFFNKAFYKTSLSKNETQLNKQKEICDAIIKQKFGEVTFIQDEKGKQSTRFPRGEQKQKKEALAQQIEQGLKLSTQQSLSWASIILGMEEIKETYPLASEVQEEMTGMSPLIIDMEEEQVILTDWSALIAKTVLAQITTLDKIVQMQKELSDFESSIKNIHQMHLQMIQERGVAGAANDSAFPGNFDAPSFSSSSFSSSSSSSYYCSVTS